MRTILILFAGARGHAHVAVFHEFAESLARMIQRRRGKARVRVVSG